MVHMLHEYCQAASVTEQVPAEDEAVAKFLKFLEKAPSQQALTSIRQEKMAPHVTGVIYWTISENGRLKDQFKPLVRAAFSEENGQIKVDTSAIDPKIAPKHTL